MIFADRLTVTKPRRTSDGYLAVRARAARSGVYDYLGREVDPKGERFGGDDTVKVYRPETEVFDQESVASFLMKPVTDNHPAKPVTADNWREVAKGVVGKALRDGDFLAFDIVLMDGATIKAVEDGKRELSNGYSSEISFEDGVAPDGTEYQAVQRMIRGNHIALVDQGRAGPLCRITDAAECIATTDSAIERLLADERTYSAENSEGNNSQHQRRETVDNGVRQMATKQIMFDGMPIEATDQSEAAIVKLQGQIKSLTDGKAQAETKVGELTATISTKDGEIAVLTKKVDDAALTPAQIETLVTDRVALIGQAKAIDPAIVTDGKSDIEIRRAIVSAKLGDAATNLDDAAIGGAFAVLAKDVKPADPVRDALSTAPVITNDAKADFDAARAKQKQNLRDAWKQPTAANAA